MSQSEGLSAGFPFNPKKGESSKDTPGSRGCGNRALGCRFLYQVISQISVDLVRGSSIFPFATWILEKWQFQWIQHVNIVA